MSRILQIVFTLGFIFADPAGAQPALDRPQDSNMKAGQLFTVRIAPGSKQIEVFVAGKNAAKFNFSDLQLHATMKVGKKRWDVVPEKRTDRFSIATPTDLPPNSKPELHLLLNHHETEEFIDFNLNSLN